MRYVHSVVFLLVAIGVTFSIHFYLWHRLVRSAALPPPWYRFASLAIVVLGASIPMAFVLARVLPRGTFGPVTLPAFIWIGVMFLLFALLLSTDVGKGLVFAFHKLRGAPVDPERRVFIARMIGGAVAVTAFGAAAWAVRSALGPIAVKEIRVPVARLPASLDGTTIVQLTDLHIGPILGRPFVESIVRTTNALAPDVVAITGDLVDGTPEQLAHAVEPLRELKARHGVYFVTGNHEYYSGVGPWLQKLAELGVRVLRNEHVTIGIDGASFDLAGVDDYSVFGADNAKNMRAAVQGRDTRRALVLLAHQPRSANHTQGLGVDLQLSGHTHGGQILPWNFLVRLTQPVVEGFGRVGDTLVYVSRGAGFWGPPMRLGAPSEITRVVLKASG